MRASTPDDAVENRQASEDASSAGDRAGDRAGARRSGGDRWEWRRRIRANPRQHRIYRIVVGVVGGLLMLLSVATGWLPGPGGIPLFLVGLAVLASEFTWAHRLLQRAKSEAHRFSAWSRRQPAWVRWSGGLLTLAGVLFAVWLFLVVIGVPGWTPDSAAGFLEGLPGVGS